MKIRITLTGTSPLLMHNPQLADPDNEITREIKSLTDIRKKTDEIRKRIERLEWYGGLYHEAVNGSSAIVQPTSKVRKCLINTAKISRLGKSVERALTFDRLNVPLVFDGPSEIDKLYEDKRYHSRLAVGVGQKKVIRVRPKFFPWSLIVDGVFVDDAGLNWDELERIVEMAGVVERIGDNRVNGYGAFEGVIQEVG